MLLVFALLAFSAPVYSSPDSVSAVPTDLGTVTANLRCLTFVNANVGYAAGASGVIIKTQDAGTTWSLVRTGGTGDDYDLRSISFSDLNNGWAISLTGRVLRTQNAGADWSEISSDLGSLFYGQERIHDSHFTSTFGFAVGGATLTQPAVWSTTSGVGSWYQASVSPQLLGSYWPAGTSTGEVVYPKEGLGYFYGLDFVPGSSTVAWAVGQDVLKVPYKSVIWSYDAGRVGLKWVQQTVTGTGKFYDVAFGTATNGVVVGDTGQIRYTKNAGTTWTAATSGLTGDIAAVDLDPTGRGWAVGASGRVIRTLDGGVTWANVPQLTGYYLEDIKWLGGDTLVAVGRSGEVIRSTDAGESWSRPLAPTLPSPPVMTSLTSSSHATGVWTAATLVSSAWTADGSNLTGYGYAIDAFADTVPGVQNTVTNSASFSVAGSGTYYVHVAAKDVYGQWSAPAHRQVLVDVTAPSIINDVPPAGYEGTALVTLTASDAHSGVDRIEHRVDGATAMLTYASQASVSIGVGSHTLSYRALDKAGNASSWTDVPVVVAPPAAPLMTALTSSSHPAGVWTASASVAAAWSASGTGITGYGWVLDSSASTVPGTQNTTGTSLSTTVAGSGTYYLHVAAKDSYNQWSAPLHRQLLVDVTAPAVGTDATTGYQGAARVTITASDAHSGVNRVEYRIDGGTVQQVSATQAQVDFGVGDYVLSYRALDNVSNASGWTDVNVSVAVPDAPVMTSLTSSSHPLGTWVKSTSILAAWASAGTDLAGYGWVLDSSATTVPNVNNTSATSLTTSVAGSGTYYLHVAAVDDFGQWSTPYHRQLLVDVTAPTVGDDAASGYVHAARVTLTASDAHSGVDRIEYTIDGGTAVPVNGSQAGVDLGVGTFTISYRAVDRAGNANGWTDVVVNVAPPAPPVMTSLTSSSHTSGTWTASASIAAAYGASGTDLSGYGRLIDSAAGTVPTVQNTTSTTWNTTVGGSGTYYLHVAAVDDYGQWSATSHRQVLVDVTAPGVTNDVTTGYVSAARVTLSASDGHSGIDRIEYRIDGGTAIEVSGNQAVVDFGVGEWTLSYRALDTAGNASGWTDVAVAVAPPAAPTITGVTSATHPAGEWVSSAALNAAWTAYGTEIVEYRWALDNDAATQTLGQSTTNTTISTTLAGSGTYYLHVAARDAYDQWSTVWHQQILMDATSPAVSDDALLTTYIGTANVRITATDQHSGVDRIEYVLNDGSTQSAYDSQMLLSLHAGTHTIAYRAVDGAGNATGWTNRTVTVDPLLTSIAGASRYLTALKACEVVFPINSVMPLGPDGHRTVIIASGANWPDALAAAGLAGAYKSPLLLTQPDLLPGIVGDQIQLLGADRAIIVGGTGAVSDDVFAQVADRVGSPDYVTRLSGTSRYATSSAIAARVVSVTGRVAWDGTALVSTGGNFPDALAAGPIAAANGWPLYLAEPQGISPGTIAAMKTAGVQRVYILGGALAVSEASREALENQGITVAERWDGVDRYATGIRIVNESLERGLSVARPALATGANFPDALAGGVMQGLDGSILMLTRPTDLPPVVASFVTTHASEIEELRVLGGTSAVSDAVRAQVLGLLAP